MRHRLLLAVLACSACAKAAEEPIGSASQPLEQGAVVARLASPRMVAADGHAPRLSPDGEWVGFSGPKMQGIVVAPAAGGESRRLTDEPAAGYKFAWSRDAAEIAYVTREDDGSRQLRTVAREGGAPKTLWTAEPGAALPFAHYARTGGLLFVDGERLRRRGESEPLTGAIPTPTFVADAGPAGLLIGSRDGLIAAGPRGEKPQTLLEGRRWFDPVVSPDGALVLVRELGAQGSDLWALERATNRRTNLGHYERGCVLPRSGLVVAELNEDDGLKITRSELWVMRADGTGAARLEGPRGTMPHRVHCAEKADRIAFVDEAAGSIWVADVEVQR